MLPALSNLTNAQIPHKCRPPKQRLQVHPVRRPVRDQTASSPASRQRRPRANPQKRTDLQTSNSQTQTPTTPVLLRALSGLLHLPNRAPLTRGIRPLRKTARKRRRARTGRPHLLRVPQELPDGARPARPSVSEESPRKLATERVR
uniref:(northern house mosquito) hypothetical protein n=1 Tax=Culex pipiens TaxID=7175 RepID=A0A8D8DAY9_CULPI